MPLDQNTLRYLRWMAQQERPLFGGHLERNEPLTDPDFIAWLRDGLIELHKNSTGYVITEKGRRAIGE